MNCQQARKIQIIDLLASMGIKPLRCKGAQCFYAIDSNDKHPNLTVNTQINKFFDFRNGSNGGPIDFIMTYNNCSLTEALRILSKSQIKSFFSNGQKSEDNETGIFIKKVKELENKALTDYLSIERKLPLFIAKKYLKECYYYTKKDAVGKPFFATCWSNVDSGLELRNKYFKGSTQGKSYSFIKGSSQGKVNVFEGMLDMLSALAYFNISECKHDTVVLNSISNYKKARSLIKKYPSVNAFLDRDVSGYNLLSKMREDLREVLDRSHCYHLYKDFNDFLKNQR